MTLKELYEISVNITKSNAQPSCAFDLSCLFSHLFGIDRYRLAIAGDIDADADASACYLALVRRYSAGEPLQYLLGEWEFYGLPFFVGEGVLIPQPDTETLVDTVLELLRGIESPIVADLCSGSGCVAVAIAHSRPDAQVFALEISDAAYGYLTKNITRNAVSVVPVHCDALAPAPLPPLDLIVSNPPYIASGELASLPPQVRREPTLALDGGGDGLDFYRCLPHVYFPLLKPAGALAFEVGYDQSESVSRLISEAGFHHVEARRDLAGINRVVMGKK